MRKSPGRAFTFLELIIILVICGILAAIAVPKFVTFREEALLAAEKQVAASVKIGISTYSLESITKKRSPQYPPVLDLARNSFAASDNPFFTVVLAPPGTTTGGWRKVIANVYQGPSGTFYFYNAPSGTFEGRVVLSDEILRLLGIGASDITADLLNQLGANNAILFANGRTLIGGSAVLIPQPGHEPELRGTDTQTETFRNLSTVSAEITGEYAGYAAQIKVGYYTLDPQTGVKTLHELFSGPDATGAKNNFTVNPGDIVGFYFTSPQGSGYTYYSQTSSNPDGKDHIKVYQNEAVRKITLGLEDLYGGGDGDFQDMIITLLY